MEKFIFGPPGPGQNGENGVFGFGQSRAVSTAAVPFTDGFWENRVFSTFPEKSVRSTPNLIFWARGTPGGVFRTIWGVPGEKVSEPVFGPGKGTCPVGTLAGSIAWLETFFGKPCFFDFPRKIGPIDPKFDFLGPRDPRGGFLMNLGHFGEKSSRGVLGPQKGLTSTFRAENGQKPASGSHTTVRPFDLGPIPLERTRKIASRDHTWNNWENSFFGPRDPAKMGKTGFLGLVSPGPSVPPQYLLPTVFGKTLFFRLSAKNRSD